MIPLIPHSLFRIVLPVQRCDLDIPACNLPSGVDAAGDGPTDPSTPAPAPAAPTPSSKLQPVVEAPPPSLSTLRHQNFPPQMRIKHTSQSPLSPVSPATTAVPSKLHTAHYPVHPCPSPAHHARRPASQPHIAVLRITHTAHSLARLPSRP